MKLLLFCVGFVTAAALADEIKLSWQQFPPAQVQPITALQIHATTDVGIPWQQWPMIGQAWPDVTTTNLIVTENTFFYIVASNAVSGFNTWDSRLKIERMK